VRSSLENLKKQAKTLRKACQSGDREALARVRAAHPRYAGSSDKRLHNAKPRLTDCQLVLAREAGLDSWSQLRVAVESANRELADQFINLACLCYDDPHFDHRSFHARAYQMLRQNPGLAETNIWSAATAGNAAAVKAFLDEKPALVNRPGSHVPLICACDSRVTPIDPTHSTFEVAKLLLDRGADPNAYTMTGNADERPAGRSSAGDRPWAHGNNSPPKSGRVAAATPVRLTIPHPVCLALSLLVTRLLALPVQFEDIDAFG
jgi:hypothetical protein